MTLPRILIVEDDKDLCRQLQKLLETETYTVDTASDGEGGLAMLEQYMYELIVLDWRLPLMEGPEIARRYRAGGGATPILMLTAEGDIDSKEKGFEAGADDYLTKPFNARELSARVKALLRRSPVLTMNVHKMGELELDLEGRTVTFQGIDVRLQKLEFALLEFLIRNQAKVFTVEVLLERVWPSDSEASIETVRGYIKTLRKKLMAVGDNPTIRNLHGQGYKLDLFDQ